MQRHKHYKLTQEAAFREKHNRFWNIWVMLALPAVMLAWYGSFAKQAKFID
jgi:hypothetical protein